MKKIHIILNVLKVFGIAGASINAYALLGRFGFDLATLFLALGYTIIFIGSVIADHMLTEVLNDEEEENA